MNPREKQKNGDHKPGQTLLRGEEAEKKEIHRFPGRAEEVRFRGVEKEGTGEERVQGLLHWLFGDVPGRALRLPVFPGGHAEQGEGQGQFRRGGHSRMVCVDG